MGMTIEELEPLEDPRHGNAERHSLHDILVIALCTILCGGETCTGMALFGHSKREFLESFLPLRNGIPSHDTFSRHFRRRGSTKSRGPLGNREPTALGAGRGVQ